MGWCSGTYTFDVAVGAILEPSGDKVSAIKDLIEEWEDMDWDCQVDSHYWEHPIVRRAFKELHPDWEWDFYDSEG